MKKKGLDIKSSYCDAVCPSVAVTSQDGRLFKVTRGSWSIEGAREPPSLSRMNKNHKCSLNKKFLKWLFIFV